MTVDIEFRTKDGRLLANLTRDFFDTDTFQYSVALGDVEAELGFAETWFTLNAAMTFAAGVGANVIANHISATVSSIIRRLQMKHSDINDSVIEIKINGMKTSHEDVRGILLALTELHPDEPDKP
jgi:hypothetical protein